LLINGDEEKLYLNINLYIEGRPPEMVDLHVTIGIERNAGDYCDDYVALGSRKRVIFMAKK
jgi:hypothetical protein